MPIFRVPLRTFQNGLISQTVDIPQLCVRTRAHNVLIVAISRFRAALCNGVSRRRASCALMAAPQSSSRLSPSIQPPAAARWRGIMSSRIGELGSAPFIKRRLVISRTRDLVARCNGAKASCRAAGTSTLSDPALTSKQIPPFA